MKQVALGQAPLERSRLAGLVARAHHILLGLFMLQFALVWLRLMLPRRLLPEANWPEGLLLILATATLVASLTRRLPGQNVMLAAFIISAIAAAVQSIGAVTAIPFGPFAYTSHIGPELFHSLPWTVPLIWLTAILACRGVARLMLRPWRKTKTYGFRCIGVTVLLAVLFDLGLEPLATQVRHYWIWTPTKLNLCWYTAPCTNFLGWGLSTLLILAFATPSLINKHPGQQRSQPDYFPLVVWLLLNLLFATASAAHHLWLAGGVITVSTAAGGVLALRGARW